MTPEESVYTMRLNRFLARSGVASRRKSDELIASGLVRVNGEVVDSLGGKRGSGARFGRVRGTIRALAEGVRIYRAEQACRLCRHAQRYTRLADGL